MLFLLFTVVQHAVLQPSVFSDPVFFDMSTFILLQYSQTQVRTTITMFSVFSVEPTTNQITGHPSLDQIAIKCDLGQPRGL